MYYKGVLNCQLNQSAFTEEIATPAGPTGSQAEWASPAAGSPAPQTLLCAPQWDEMWEKRHKNFRGRRIYPEASLMRQTNQRMLCRFPLQNDARCSNFSKKLPEAVPMERPPHFYSSSTASSAPVYSEMGIAPTLRSATSPSFRMTTLGMDMTS